MDYVKAKAHTTVPRADVAWMETVEPGEVIRVADLPPWFQEKLASDPWTSPLFEEATAAEFTEWIGDEEALAESEPMPVVAARQAAVQQAADDQKARDALKTGRKRAGAAAE